VIINRLQAFSGKTSVLDGEGAIYAEMRESELGVDKEAACCRCMPRSLRRNSKISRASGAGVKNQATPAANDVIRNEKTRAFNIGVLSMRKR
jgi:hypothetical protein